MQIILINPETGNPYPSAQTGGRTFYAIEPGQRYIVRVESSYSSQEQEYVVAVDGRNVLNNEDAKIDAPGLITNNVCDIAGFRTSGSTVREFVAGSLGYGNTTAERNGSAQFSGLIWAAVYQGSKYRQPPRTMRMAGLENLRGGDEMVSFGADASPSRGGSIGTVAGQERTDRVGQTTWFRSEGQTPTTIAVEYDTAENLRRRNVFVPMVNQNWPLRRPGSSGAFCKSDTL
jgi:hypothetical protein